MDDSHELYGNSLELGAERDALRAQFDLEVIAHFEEVAALRTKLANVLCGKHARPEGLYSECLHCAGEKLEQEVARINATNHELLDRIAQTEELERRVKRLEEQRDLLQGSLGESRQDNVRLREALEGARDWANQIVGDDRVTGWVHREDYGLYCLLADCPVNFDAALAATPAAAAPEPGPLDVCECGHELRTHNGGCDVTCCDCAEFEPKQREEGQG